MFRVIKKKQVGQKKLMRRSRILSFILGGVIGAVLGWFLVSRNVEIRFGHLFFMFFALYAALILHTIIHEGGHLVFGLLSGYRFISFRVFNLMLVKRDGKIILKRHSLPGSSGQCLMAPPKLIDGKMPVVLYNMGGCLSNLLFSMIFLAIGLWINASNYVQLTFLLLAVAGFLSAVLNAVPMHTGLINNDGQNTLEMLRNPKAVRALWINLKLSEQLANEIRLQNMPEEWFAVPSDDEMSSGLIASIGAFACCRLMDEHRFEDADRLMKHLLSIDSGMLGVHRTIMTCDRVFCELIGESRREALVKMLTKEQKDILKKMKNEITVLRTKYAYSLLYDKNLEKTVKIKKEFEMLAKHYPYLEELRSEQELMAHAADIAVERGIISPDEKERLL